MASSRGKFAWIVGGLVAVIGVGAAADYWTAYPVQTNVGYVGRAACVECHVEQNKAFAGSHHDLAMDVANDQTVLGDFSGVTLTHHGVTSRMFRDGDRFMIHTEGPDGEMADFEITHTFGVDPLQQYMVEFADERQSMDSHGREGALSRLQVLRVSWDVHAGRWFHLDPPDVNEKLQPDDPLHWTGTAQRWQTMCAECHSTHLQPNYDVASGKYHTTFSDIDVSCESCHGPGSLHVEMARSKRLFWDRHHGYGLANLKSPDPEVQLQSCAPCHSRRGILDRTFAAGDAFDDHYDLGRLTEATYHDDGQIKDEVYVYGSFIQSKMYHKGIRCTDCHDPHTLRLKHPGNETCTSCHQHAAGKYDTPAHHHHAVGTAGAQCVNCHMPHTTFMAIDDRRDHSLRVPRPDLSLDLGTPNACSQCHLGDGADTLDPTLTEPLNQYADWVAAAATDPDSPVAAHVRRIDQWCNDACDRWYGRDRQTPPHYATALAKFRSGEPGAAKSLLKIAADDSGATPAIVRASAFESLMSQPNPRRVVAVAKKVAGDTGQPVMVRAAAIRVLAADPGAAENYVRSLLGDQHKLVRIAAAETLLAAGVFATLSGNDQSRLLDVTGEIKTAVDASADQVHSHLRWASVCEATNRPREAIAAYQNAIRVDPNVAGPRSNYAALLERLADRQSATRRQSWIQSAARLRREELPLLARDAELVPNIPEVQYRYAMALYLDGQRDRAESKLAELADQHPDSEIYRAALDAIRRQRRGGPVQ